MNFTNCKDRRSKKIDLIQKWAMVHVDTKFDAGFIPARSRNVFNSRKSRRNELAPTIAKLAERRGCNQNCFILFPEKQSIQLSKQVITERDSKNKTT